MSDKDPAAPNPQTAGAQAPDKALLEEMLVCPVTRTPLRYDAEAHELVAEASKLAYPIRDGIPIMLPEEARPLEA